MRQWKQTARALMLTAVTAIAVTAEAHAVDGIRIPGLNPILTPAAAPAGEEIFLGYNYSTGAAATGRIDANGNYAPLKTHSFDRAWSHIVPTTNGLVLFFNVNTGMAATGRVGADGSFQDLRTYAGFEDYGHQVVSTRDGILLFYRVVSDRTGYKGLAVTGRLDANGNYIRLSEPYLFDFWTHIVPTTDGLVLFYNAGTGVAATGRIDVHGGFRDLKSYRNFDPWTHIVSTTDGTLLFYNSATGAAGTGRIDANGNYADLQSFHLGTGTQVVPTTTNRVMFFRGNVALVGQIDAQGALTGGLLVRGLSTPGSVVFVR